METLVPISVARTNAWLGPIEPATYRCLSVNSSATCLANLADCRFSSYAKCSNS